MTGKEAIVNKSRVALLIVTLLMIAAIPALSSAFAGLPKLDSRRQTSSSRTRKAKK